jgi:hypothetical protein
LNHGHYLGDVEWGALAKTDKHLIAFCNEFDKGFDELSKLRGKSIFMKNIRISFFCFALFCLAGCVVGEITGDRFYLKSDFTVKLLNEDWQVIRQKREPLNPAVTNSAIKIAFVHKKSNGYIGAESFVLNDVDQARSLRVHADAVVASWHATILSEKETKIDGIDAIEVVMSNSRIIKWVFMKKGNHAYALLYYNTPKYFDEYLDVFDEFVESFKTL